MIDHRSELLAQAQAYLEELRAATAAAHDRLRAGTMSEPLFEDEPLPRAIEDPLFATREFDVPREAVAGLVDFSTEF